jgi:hypothetical protein
MTFLWYIYYYFRTLVNTLTTPYKNHIASSSHLSQPHFEASVKMRFALPKVGTWSPPRLPKCQSSIVGVKKTRLEVLFIPLERS